MIALRMKPWRRFSALLDESVIQAFLQASARGSADAFRKGMRSRKSGVYYYGRSRRVIRASAPGEYPAIDTGDLERSIGTIVRRRSFTIGTRKYYAKFLRYGTSRMKPRKMSDDALQEGVQTARHRLRGFATWRRT